MLATNKRHDNLATEAVQYNLGVQSRGQVDRIDAEAIWLFGPCRADSFVRCKAMKGLEPPGEVVSIEEGGKVIFKLPVGLIVISPDGCLLQRPVHPFDLAVGPWVLGLVTPVIDAMPPAGPVEGVAAPARVALKATMQGRPRQEAGPSPAEHRDSHPATAAYACGRRQLPLPPRQSERWSVRSSAHWRIMDKGPLAPLGDSFPI